jgi:hypothetical protein
MSERSVDVEQHLRAASDAILLLLAEVGQLEQHKRGVPAGQDRFDELATSVRRASEALAQFTRQEEAWALDSSLRDGNLGAIADSASSPTLAAILERWRAVERKLNDAEPGSAEASRLFAEFQRVRDEYLEAFRVREHL